MFLFLEMDHSNVCNCILVLFVHFESFFIFLDCLVKLLLVEEGISSVLDSLRILAALDAGEVLLEG